MRAHHQPLAGAGPIAILPPQRHPPSIWLVAPVTRRCALAIALAILPSRFFVAAFAPAILPSRLSGPAIALPSLPLGLCVRWCAPRVRVHHQPLAGAGPLEILLPQRYAPSIRLAAPLSRRCALAIALAILPSRFCVAAFAPARLPSRLSGPAIALPSLPLGLSACSSALAILLPRSFAPPLPIQPS